MKNKKGFTLVELVAVVAFIAIIILIATPNIINQIRKNKQTRYDNFIGDLCLAAEAYINHNDLDDSLQNENDTEIISINKLASEKYIKSGLINPKTNEGVTNKGIEVKLNSDKTYTCKLVNTAPITVTLDYNDGTNKTKTKEVIVGGTYGTLPTPTRSGYTFKGWNGKNIINLSDLNITLSNAYYKDSSGTPKYTMSANTTYTLSFEFVINSSSTNPYFSIGYGNNAYQSDIYQCGNYSQTGKNTCTFTTPASFSYQSYFWARLVRFASPQSANVDISKVQLEEGSTATEYEPYKIEASTTVVQTTDHTLTAIWEAN